MRAAEQLDTINITVAEYESLKVGMQQLEHDNKRLSDQLAVLMSRMFGRSSERLDPDQLRLFAGKLLTTPPGKSPSGPTRCKP